MLLYCSSIRERRCWLIIAIILWWTKQLTTFRRLYLNQTLRWWTISCKFVLCSIKLSGISLWAMLTAMTQRKKYYNKQRFLLRLLHWTVNTLRRTVKANLRITCSRLLTLIDYRLPVCMLLRSAESILVGSSWISDLLDYPLIALYMVKVEILIMVSRWYKCTLCISTEIS